jgi:hypothetical protein
MTRALSNDLRERAVVKDHAMASVREILANGLLSGKPLPTEERL